MNSVEVCIDRARLNLPPEEDRNLCSSYPLSLGRIVRMAENPDWMLVASRGSLGTFRDFNRAKSDVSAWTSRSGCCVGVKDILQLIKTLTDKCHCLEDLLEAEVLLDAEQAALPSELEGMDDSECEDLRRVILLSYLRRNDRHPTSDGGSTIVLTRLPGGCALTQDVSVAGAVFTNDGRAFRKEVASHCMFTGDPNDLVSHVDPKPLWLSAGGDVSQLALALELQVLKTVGENGLTFARRWKLGCEFVAISSKYRFMSDGFRAGVLLKAMAAKILDVPKAGDHRLHQTAKSQDSDRYRTHEDGSKDTGMHTYITKKGLRLNYWDCADGSIEFGSAMDHAREQLLPEC
jgi:hypothetical protein